MGGKERPEGLPNEAAGTRTGRNEEEDLERSGRLPGAAAALEGSDAHPDDSGRMPPRLPRGDHIHRHRVELVMVAQKVLGCYVVGRSDVPSDARRSPTTCDEVRIH